ncbi:MAG TPA: hypothetical protein VKY85_02575 [Candidatus Angelobacter sp.]|nr:hypothetical protein [Candidatus Angelobacter sp.]
MPILGGFHVEGNDHLILHALLAKLLTLREDEIQVDFIDSQGRGWQFVLELIPRALKRFYGQCAQFALIGVDNDGNVDLDQTGGLEDVRHPRHEHHPDAVDAGCRYCVIAQAIERVRPQLNWIEKKPGAAWPILIAVPVEMIETWLLMLQGAPGIQRKPRSIQKQRLYGKPVATRADVMSIAVPLVRSMTPERLAGLTQASASFRDFRRQVTAVQANICENTTCW